MVEEEEAQQTMCTNEFKHSLSAWSPCMVTRYISCVPCMQDPALCCPIWLLLLADPSLLLLQHQRCCFMLCHFALASGFSAGSHFRGCDLYQGQSGMVAMHVSASPTALIWTMRMNEDDR